MKKSVLTSLIAASAIFTGVAFAGGYTADAGYTAADTSAMGGSNSFVDSLYFGVGINRTADTNFKSTDQITATTYAQAESDTQKVGYGFLIGKHFNRMFAIEGAYNTYGTNSFRFNATTLTNEYTSNYYGMWSGTLSGVVNSPSYNGFSAHAKLGAAYFSENVKTAFDTSNTAYYQGSYAAFNPVFGFGLQYEFDQVAISFDWTRIAVSDTASTDSAKLATASNVPSSAIYAPDQLSLNIIYNVM